MLPNAEANIKKLQKICEGSKERLLELASQWEEHRQPLVSHFNNLMNKPKSLPMACTLHPLKIQNTPMGEATGNPNHYSIMPSNTSSPGYVMSIPSANLMMDTQNSDNIEPLNKQCFYTFTLSNVFTAFTVFKNVYTTGKCPERHQIWDATAKG